MKTIIDIKVRNRKCPVTKSLIITLKSEKRRKILAIHSKRSTKFFYSGL